jgi:hypothetical protein
MGSPGMTLGLWITALATCLGGISAFATNLISITMINRVNAQVPTDEHLPVYGSSIYKARRLFKKLFPDDRLPLWQNFYLIVMLLSFVLVIRFWVLG